MRTNQNGGHFADNIVKCIFLNENAHIFIKIIQKFIPMGPNVNAKHVSDSGDEFAPRRWQAITWSKVDPDLRYHIDRLVQERHNSTASQLTHWSYVFLALTHRYGVTSLGHSEFHEPHCMISLLSGP